MILIAHLLFGATIGSIVKNTPLAILLAFLSHYFLDPIPHIEYPIENIQKKQWRKILPDVLMVSADFLLGILLIFIFSNNLSVAYMCAIFAIIPDGLSILNLIIKNKILQIHSNFHREKIHFLKYKKIPVFWRILSQVLIIILSVILLKTY